MIAGLSPRPASTFLSTQLSAKFRSPPGNQRGHWIPRALSSTRSYGRVQRTPRSRTTASQYHSGSTMLRRWSSSSEPIWWARMKRPMRERSTYSFVGRQTISRLPASVMGSLPTGGVYPEAGRRPTRGIDTGCGLRHELHQRTRDGDQAAADRIGREAETFERVGAEERRRLGRREDEKRDHGADAHADPALADVVLDAPAVREHEGVADMGRDAEPQEQRGRNGRVGRAPVDQRLERPEAAHQHEEEHGRCGYEQRADADGIADHPGGTREGARDSAAVERRHRDEVEQVQQDRGVPERHQEPLLERESGGEHHPRGDGAHDRARHRDPRLDAGVPGPAVHRDEGADERNEHGRARRNALDPQRDRVAALVDEDQQDEADGEQPAPLHGVGADREQHRREGLPPEDAREEAEDLGLAQDEEETGTGGARRGAPAARRAGGLRRPRTLEALIPRAQVLDLPRTVPAGARRGHVAVVSLGGRGMIQAS